MHVYVCAHVCVCEFSRVSQCIYHSAYAELRCQASCPVILSPPCTCPWGLAVLCLVFPHWSCQSSLRLSSYTHWESPKPTRYIFNTHAVTCKCATIFYLSRMSADLASCCCHTQACFVKLFLPLDQRENYVWWCYLYSSCHCCHHWRAGQCVILSIFTTPKPFIILRLNLESCIYFQIVSYSAFSLEIFLQCTEPGLHFSPGWYKEVSGCTGSLIGVHPNWARVKWKRKSLAPTGFQKGKKETFTSQC